MVRGCVIFLQYHVNPTSQNCHRKNGDKTLAPYHRGNAHCANAHKKDISLIWLGDLGLHRTIFNNYIPAILPIVKSAEY